MKFFFSGKKIRAPSFSGAQNEAETADFAAEHRLSADAYAVLTEYFNGIIVEIDLRARKILSRQNFSHDVDIRVNGGSFISDMIIQDQVHFSDKAQLGIFSDKLYSAVPSEPVSARIKNTVGEFVWYRFAAKHLNAEAGKNARVICSIVNIDGEKRESEAQREAVRRYRSILAASCDTIIEVDLSDDKIISQDDIWRRQISLEEIPTFSNYIETEAAFSVYPDDAEKFKTTFLPLSLLDAYKHGKASVSLEYRIQSSGKMEWHTCTMNIIEDKISGHTHAVAYIKDITEKKLKELEVVSLAERDSLTHLYNKRTSQIYIEEYLSGLGQDGHHALFIIDLDNFKSINDNFGHPFGDAVLNDVAERLSVVFRTTDIVSRIGGDEFLVFAKNIQIEIIHQKARQLVERLRNTYATNHTSYTVSGSVGICCFPEDGRTYSQLYENADTALYNVKKEKKNAYCLFNSGLAAVYGAGMSLARENDFDCERMSGQKSFSENLIDYVFRILYESKKNDEGISLVLALIGKRYKADRAYIFLNSDDGLFCTNTHEWCAEGIIPQIDELQHISYGKLGGYQENFNSSGIFYCRDIRILHPDVHDILSQQSVQSLIQCAIVDSGLFRGFIGFDYCHEKIGDDGERVESLLTVSRMLGVFLLKERVRNDLEHVSVMYESVLSAFDANMYAVNADTFEILFADKKLSRRTRCFSSHTPCYKVLHNLAEQCPICPLRPRKEKRKKDLNGWLDPVKNEQLKISAQKITWHGVENAFAVCRIVPKNDGQTGAGF